MSPRRFLAPAGSLVPGELPLPAEEAAHARKVLRLSPGEEVELIDGAGARALGVLTHLNKQGGAVRVESVDQAPAPLPELVLCPGLLKGPAMDLIAVKLTELACDQVRPVLSQRAVPRLKDPGAKQERWSRLARQALKQCGAARAPSFAAPAPLDDLLAAAPDDALKLLLYEQEQGVSLARVLAQAAAPRQVWVLVGPEGGWAPQEAEAAQAAGFVSCGLPHTILRAETACLAVASVIRFGREYEHGATL
ncbi:MAG: 16S rRNA (uracil(1498)-N(3))-methyltransferase [Desulfarculaceae bacterium]|nr:16S rRNA (uracil(1498)-N(3))-methyltransferase [Desulfarculaceae bacterium]MCF8073040.1 16S rRNA (uracil(1498)-N(3))-methyltransferase [Desulfarculaceae bacterium]MCF8101875.1 16S rRNA (uracil(1498)-N(3))-methyltransferase [Desulfarculaceae bacterium]MCF8115402.1 16S rRNA (uracil(1498)-N(3))-methyltransferase [Desulfarculaceae bacterium]